MRGPSAKITSDGIYVGFKRNANCLSLSLTMSLTMPLGEAAYPNLVNSFFASPCVSRRPIIAFTIFHLRSSSWPSVNSP